MGIDKADFIDGFKAALNDSQVLEALKTKITEQLIEAMNATVVEPLQKEINELKDIIVKKDKQLTDLEAAVKVLQNKCDNNEQYSR